MKYFILIVLFFMPTYNFTIEKPAIPLMASIKLGSKKLLLQHLHSKPNLNEQDELGNTVLHYAVHLQHKTITDILLMHHANPHITNQKGQSPLSIAYATGNGYIIRRLELYGGAPSQRTHEQSTFKNYQPLNKQYIRYAKSGNLQELQRVIRYPTVDKNIQWGKFKRTALMYATRNNRKEAVDYLVNQLHVDHTIKDQYGWTAYDYAKRKNNPEIINLLCNISAA